MNQQYDLEDLEDFLAGRMSASDRATFEEALASDPELHRRLEALQAEPKMEQLLRESLLLEQFGQWEQEISREKRQKRRPGMLWLGIGALALALLGWYWFRTSVSDLPAPPPALQPDTLPGNTLPQAPKEIAIKPDEGKNPPTSGEALAANAFVEEDFRQNLMGAGNQGGQESKYARAVAFYAAGKYEAALALLEKPESGQMEEFLYLRGYTYYHLKRFDKAEQDFRAFRNFPVSDRKMDALWCEVCCMLQQLPGASKRLEILLQEIASSPDNTYADRARALRKALNH